MKTKHLEAKTVGILSDLHLAPGAMSRCSATDAELCELIREMKASCDVVVVAGDLFDLSRPKFPVIGWRAHLEQTRITHPKAVGMLESLVWVYGNHDRWLVDAGAFERVEVTWEGAKLLIQHGHQFDVPMKQIRPLEAAGNFMAGWLVRAGLEEWAERMGDVPVWVHKQIRGPRPAGESSKKSTDRGALGAQSLLEAERVDVVAMGHSHVLRVVPSAAGLFVNTGSLCCGHLDWARVDLESRNVEIYRDGAKVGETPFRS